jgi:hypothetical protein
MRRAYVLAGTARWRIASGAMVLLVLALHSDAVDAAYFFHDPGPASSPGHNAVLLQTFASHELSRQACLTDIRAAELDFYRPFFAAAKSVALVGVPSHGNLGDTLLTLGELRLFTHFVAGTSSICRFRFPACFRFRVCKKRENREKLKRRAARRGARTARPAACA